MPYDFKIGDRVGGVGTVGTVSHVADDDGDVRIVPEGRPFDTRGYVSAEGLLLVADLPRLAKERAPFKVGDKVKIPSEFPWTMSSGGVDVHPRRAHSAVGVVTSLTGNFHKDNVRVRPDGASARMGFDIHAAVLEPVAEERDPFVPSGTDLNALPASSRMWAMPERTARADLFREARGLCGPNTSASDVLDVAMWLEEGAA